MTQDDKLPEHEIERRREAALKRMLNTPHKPHKPSGKQQTSPDVKTTGKGRVRVGKSKR